MKPLFIVNHRRTGIAALNVVTAALDTDPRTLGTEVRFATSPGQIVSAIVEARGAGRLPVVGWSFYSTDFLKTCEERAWVSDRTAALDVLHVAGGVHSTAEPEQTLRAGFDLVAVGEGESTVVELFAALTDGRDLRSLQGLAHLDAGRPIVNGSGERRPLDDFPAFNARYRKWNALEITRGCIYACSFCQTPFMFKARFRHRSLDGVRAHVAELARSGARFVRFLTPTCLSYGSEDSRPNLDAVEALLAAARTQIGAEGKIYFGTFPSEVRPEHVTRESLALIARFADNRTLVIGGQSGSERLLAATHRGHDVEAIKSAVRLAVQAGFRPDVDFLFGLPGENDDDRRATLALAAELVERGARIHSHTFMPLPGTPLKDARPVPIEPGFRLALARLESRGALYGQWRQQLVKSAELVRLRATAKKTRTAGSPPERP